MICNAELCRNYFSVNITILAISPTISKKLTILAEIVGFLKTVGETQQLVRKRSQKIHYDVILHYISLPICPLHFSKFCPIQKQWKTLRNCRYLVKTTLAIYLIFLQIHIFWNFDDISRIYNQINYRNIWFLKVIIILSMTLQVLFFNVFSKKDPHLNAVELHFVLPHRKFLQE